jgi:hypothetical protein
MHKVCYLLLFTGISIALVIYVHIYRENKKIKMLRPKNNFSNAVLTASLIVLMGVAVFFKPTPQYPNVELITPENVQVTVLLNSIPNAEDCRQTLDTLIDTFKPVCPSCRIQKQQCLQVLTTQQQKLLSTAPLSYPSARTLNAVATYISPDSNIALAAC